MIEGDPGQTTEGATGDIDGIDAAALMSSIQSTGSAPAAEPAPAAQAAPAAAPQAPAAQAAPAAAAPPPWATDTIDVNGKPFTASREQILKWAASGRSAPQLIHAERQKLQAEYAQKEAQYKTYAEIDAFAKANPQWWQTVEQSYQQQNQAPATPQVPPELLQKVDKLTQFQSNFEKEQANKALDAEVQDIRTKYPDLAWDSLDENGQSLEMRVYDHAVKNGIQSFKTAFRDLMHDQLIKYNADKAREAAVKELQAQRKQGLVGVSTTPQHTPPAAQPRKYKDWDTAAAAAMHAHNIATG